MPERFPTKQPTVFVGSTLFSGQPNTGQVLNTNGGTNVHSVLSGSAGGHQTIWAGAGRLDAAFMHDSALIALSGQPITFYDAATSFSGNVSGVKVLGVLAPGPQEGAATGISGNALRGGQLRTFGFPFTSGLCATGASGQPGWSCTFTPVVSN